MSWFFKKWKHKLELCDENTKYISDLEDEIKRRYIDNEIKRLSNDVSKTNEMVKKLYNEVEKNGRIIKHSESSPTFNLVIENKIGLNKRNPSFEKGYVLYLYINHEEYKILLDSLPCTDIDEHSCRLDVKDDLAYFKFNSFNHYFYTPKNNDTYDYELIADFKKGVYIYKSGNCNRNLNTYKEPELKEEKNMNDCFWCFINGCCNADHCNGCEQYLSVNSSEGQEMFEEYRKEVEEYLEPLYEKYREKMKSFVNTIDNDIV